MSSSGPLGALVTGYVERVVNQRDLTAVDDLVSPDYVGTGPWWPATLEELRRFYADQARERPDWHIEVQETVEVGDSVVVRAVAGGTVTEDGVARRTRLQWLAHYRVVEGRITQIDLLDMEPLD